MATKNSSAVRVVREEFLDPQADRMTEAVAAQQATERAQARMPLLEIPPSPQEIAEQSARVASPARPTVISHPAAETLTTEAKNLRASWHLFQSMLGVMLVISMVLAARGALFAAIGIAGLLAWRTLENPTLMSLSVSIGFSATVVVPCVVLYWRRG